MEKQFKGLWKNSPLTFSTVERLKLDDLATIVYSSVARDRLCKASLKPF
jgi:hypothetical protein